MSGNSPSREFAVEIFSTVQHERWSFGKIKASRICAEIVVYFKVV